jgi:hypothetical protein
MEEEEEYTGTLFYLANILCHFLLTHLSYKPQSMSGRPRVAWSGGGK